MVIYKVYEGKVCAIEVVKETSVFFCFAGSRPEFGYSKRVEKKFACLTPQEAIQEELNGRRTIKGAFENKLARVNEEISNLEKLEKEYHAVK